MTRPKHRKRTRSIPRSVAFIAGFMITLAPTPLADPQLYVNTATAQESPIFNPRSELDTTQVVAAGCDAICEVIALGEASETLVSDLRAAGYAETDHVGEN